MEELFRNYFEEAKNIGDLAVLADAASKVGVDRTAAFEYLQSGKDHEETLNESLSWTRRGVRGVPYFIFEKKYAVSGAQEPELLVELIEELTEQ